MSKPSKLKSEFAYHKYKMQLTQETRKTYDELEQVLNSTTDPDELRASAKVLAQSAFDQACENYDYAIAAIVSLRRYKIAVFLINIFLIALVMTNLAWLLLLL